ncbi:hypothetical protein ASL14_14755 [Paenibacillus sp. IHB B 3084]|nr:hypothetical protein ASL14_14755 [Paenibacillus sp. IHB B 3084]
MYRKFISLVIIFLLISVTTSSFTRAASNYSYDHVTLPTNSANNKNSFSAVTYDVYNTTSDNAIFFNNGNAIQGI